MNKTPSSVTQNRKATPVSLLLLFVTLAIVWLLWSGLYKPLVLGLGVFSCFLSVLLAHRMGFFRHQAMWRVLPRLPGYWWWVLKEIVSSSIDVAKIVLSPKLEISPVVVEFEAQTQSEVSQAILGNAITLSPGTVTLDVHEGKLLVHCLTERSARSLVDGESNARAANLGLG